MFGACISSFLRGGSLDGFCGALIVLEVGGWKISWNINYGRLLRFRVVSAVMGSQLVACDGSVIYCTWHIIQRKAMIRFVVIIIRPFRVDTDERIETR